MEAFDVAVLHRPAGSDEIEFHADAVRPGVHRLAGELAAVVGRDRFRRAPPRPAPRRSLRSATDPRTRKGTHGCTGPRWSEFGTSAHRQADQWRSPCSIADWRAPGWAAARACERLVSRASWFATASPLRHTAGKSAWR